MTSYLRSKGLLILITGLAICLPAFTMACGGDDDDGGSEATTSAATDGAATTPAASEARTIDVSLNSFFFDPAAITVAAGEAVKFSITNDSSAPHDMRIAGPDGEFETEDDTLQLEVKPDKTAVLSYTAPDEPGEIIFRCDFHPAQMSGTITVE